MAIDAMRSQFYVLPDSDKYDTRLKELKKAWLGSKNKGINTEFFQLYCKDSPYWNVIYPPAEENADEGQVGGCGRRRGKGRGDDGGSPVKRRRIASIKRETP